jgi:ribosomal subunit interface protein
VNDVQIDFVGRGIDLNDEIRAYAEDKLAGTVRFLEEPVEIRVVLEATGHRRIAEVHLHHRFGVMQAVEETDDLRTSIHDAAAKVEKQARRARKKFIDQRHRAGQDSASVPEA